MMPMAERSVQLQKVSHMVARMEHCQLLLEPVIHSLAGILLERMVRK